MDVKEQVVNVLVDFYWLRIVCSGGIL